MRIFRAPGATLFALLFLSGFGAHLHASQSPYEMVNGGPQLSVEGWNFSVYLSLWRGLTAEETQKLWPWGGDLVSRRQIRWEARDCVASKIVNSDQEQFYFLDNLRFGLDFQKKIVPIREAQRPGYRYLVLSNFDTSRLPTPMTGTRGTYGMITIESEHRLFSNSSEIKHSDFMTLKEDENYPSSDLIKYDLADWPVYPDERAHKPFSLNEPRGFSSNVGHINTTNFEIRIFWSACDEKHDVDVWAVASSPLPPSGPTRSNRQDRGDQLLPVTVSKFWYKFGPAKERPSNLKSHGP